MSWYLEPKGIRLQIDKYNIEVNYYQGLYLWIEFVINGKDSRLIKAFDARPFLNAINERDLEKLHFLEVLCESKLRLEKHLSFDFKRLLKAINKSKKIRETFDYLRKKAKEITLGKVYRVNNYYYIPYVEDWLGYGFKVIRFSLQGYQFFECFIENRIQLGLIVTGKKTVGELHEISEKEFFEGLLKFIPLTFESEKLPNEIQDKLVKYKLTYS